MASSSRSTPRSAQAMPGVIAVYTGEDVKQYGTLQVRAPVQEPRRLRHEEAADGRRCRPTRCASSAIRSPAWWRETLLQAKDAAEAVEVDIDPLPVVTKPDAAVAAARQPCSMTCRATSRSISTMATARRSKRPSPAPRTRSSSSSSTPAWSSTRSSRARRSAATTPRNERFTLHSCSQGVMGLKAGLVGVMKRHRPTRCT